MSINKIYTLSNGLRIAFIGKVYPIIFDDNTFVPFDSNQDVDIILVTVEASKKVIRNITLNEGTGIIELQEWVKDQIDSAVLRYKDGEIDILLTNISALYPTHKYLSTYYPDVPIYTVEIFDYDNNVPVCKINSFYKYLPNFI